MIVFKKTQLYCPQCLFTKIVKNGINKRGIQKYLCKKCGKQFQTTYYYKGCCRSIRLLIIKMLVNGCGIRSINIILGVSINCIIRTLIKMGGKIIISPRKNYGIVNLRYVIDYLVLALVISKIFPTSL